MLTDFFTEMTELTEFLTEIFEGMTEMTELGGTKQRERKQNTQKRTLNSRQMTFGCLFLLIKHFKTKMISAVKN